MTIPKTSLKLGRLFATPAVLAAVPHPELLLCLARHQTGDWGEALPEGDRRLNDEAVLNGNRILSAYESTKGVRFWLITEADRSLTTALLPEEY